MASRKKRARQTEEVSIGLPDGLEKGIRSLGEPLFISPLFAFALSVYKPFAGGGFVSDSSPFVLLALSLWCSYAIYSNKRLKSDFFSYGVPALMLLTTLFSYYSNNYGYPLDKDYTYFSMMVAIFGVFYTLTYHGLLEVELSIMLALFASTLLIHIVPALAPILSNLDSYWHYKWMQGFYNDGYQPEYDPLVYPMYGGLQRHNDPTYVSQHGNTFGLEQKTAPMLMQMTYASLALALKPLGVSLYDVAMLFPGILAALTVVVMYLLVKEMFSEMPPYNMIAGFLAAFMLMLSPALAMNSTATNCEDDSFGMFLMVGSLFLFFASYHRRSYFYSVLCGVAFLMFRMGWGASTYGMLTLGAFGTLYAFVNFLRNRNAMEHLPYILIPFLFYQLMGLVAHERGGMPVYHPMAPVEIYPLMAAIGMSLILEFLRARWRGPLFVNDGTLEGRTLDYVERHIKVVGGIALALAILSLIFYKTPLDWADFVYANILSAKEKSLVHQTVAEQNPMAESLQDFFGEGYNRYGVALLYGVLMMPVLAGLVWYRGSSGALFLLTWSIPMMWGAYNKSAWIFASSPSVTALGATIGLFSAAKRTDLEGYRVIGAILMLFILPLYVPMLGPTLYQKSVGYIAMHMGPTSDIFYWQPALEWHRDHTKPGDAILTWWDYGHWFTSVSHRPVLIDNLQADYYEIQDVARFFVNKTTEDEAFKIVEAYNNEYKEQRGWGLNYATIDWTMIGKGSALHYIATGVIEDRTPGSWKNYIQCEFMPEQSQLEEKLTVQPDGSFGKTVRVVFNCQNQILIVFSLEGDALKETTVYTPNGNKVPWGIWSKANDASLLGVQPLLGLGKGNIPSIMACALNWNKVPAGSICRMPQFNTLVYVPQEFNDFMMTRLYLGKYLDEYKALGFYNREVVPLKHFREVPDYNGDGMEDGEFSFGFVRSYEISYGGFSSSTAAADSVLPAGQ